MHAGASFHWGILAAHQPQRSRVARATPVQAAAEWIQRRLDRMAIFTHGACADVRKKQIEKAESRVVKVRENVESAYFKMTFLFLKSKTCPWSTAEITLL
jgi:hypothetical protein